MSMSVTEYLSRTKDQTIPPLMLELILRSAKSFYLKRVFGSTRRRRWCRCASGICEP